MKIDRRQFMQLGTMAAFATTACHGNPKPDLEAPGTKGPRVAIGFEGLYLIEEKKPAMTVHLVDAQFIGMPAHLPQLKVLASHLDKKKTTKPDKDHVIPAGIFDEFWLWDLKGLTVTTPPSENGDSDLIPPDNSAEDGDDIPQTEAGWNSLARVPDLRVCCGSTMIAKRDALASSITLTHGRLSVPKPDGVGSRAVWKFTDPDGKQLMHRAVSNKLVYSCPTNLKQLEIRVGEQPIVFKSLGGDAFVTNLPTMKAPTCPSPCTPNMDHFKALCGVMNKTFDPTITLAAFTPKAGQDAGADYCPGGRG